MVKWQEPSFFCPPCCILPLFVPTGHRISNNGPAFVWGTRTSLQFLFFFFSSFCSSFLCQLFLLSFCARGLKGIVRVAGPAVGRLALVHVCHTTPPPLLCSRILYNFSGKILLKCEKLCSNVQNCAQMCKIVLKCAKLCKIVLKHAKLCSNLQSCA